MTNTDIFKIVGILVLIFGTIIGSIYYLGVSIRKQVIKEIAILNDLKKRSEKIITIEEVKSLHVEFCEKARKIHTDTLFNDMSKLDGYLRGKYDILSHYDESGNFIKKETI
jgi:hypothetical protein